MRTAGIAVIVALMVGCGAAGSSPAAKAPATAGHAGSEAYPAAEAAPGTGATMPAQPGYYPSAPSPEPASASPSPGSPSTSPLPMPAPATASVAGAAKGGAASPVAVAPAPPPPPRETRTLPQAGQLTAGIWDDNRNFDFWKPYAARFTEQNGRDFAMFEPHEIDAARAEASAPHGQKNELDIQLVLDTTGSMGDELSYLQSELDSIAVQVHAKLPNVTPRWSLVVYKDHGEAYVAKGFDFTSDTAKFRSNLRAQSAGGGGDTPEAVVEGLTTGLRQHWRASAGVAKIVFWVADAPAHPGEGKKLAAVIREAKSRGVHIYPVASSDADDAAEYQMRAAAQMTSGRYVFLTSDSGIGNSHAEPHIPCYNVSRLDHAIVRMIEVEMSGRSVEADPKQVLRSVGKPNKEGKCQLSSGMLVASY